MRSLVISFAHAVPRTVSFVTAILACLVTVAGPTPAEADEPLAVFHVGNSLTDQAYGMHDIAKARFADRKSVQIIPVGEVMYRLHLRMKNGEVPGYRHIADLYEDGVHLKSEGKYLEAVTHYAVVFQDDPHGCITSGLRFWRGPYSVDKEFAEFVWDVVAEVVKPPQPAP